MFKQVIQNRISHILKDYVEDFAERQQLEFSIDFFSRQGELKMTQLRLKEDALKTLQLPVRLKSGYIGKVNVVIPWTNFTDRAVQVELEDIYLILGRTHTEAFDYEAHREGQRKAKRDLIQNADDREALLHEQVACMLWGCCDHAAA